MYQNLATEKDEKRLKGLLWGMLICGVILTICGYYILDDLCWRNAATLNDTDSYNQIMNTLIK